MEEPYTFYEDIKHADWLRACALEVALTDLIRAVRALGANQIHEAGARSPVMLELEAALTRATGLLPPEDQ